MTRYWNDGRVAITSPLRGSSGGVELFSSVDGVRVVDAKVWEMGNMWVSPSTVLATPRLDNKPSQMARLAKTTNYSL